MQALIVGCGDVGARLALRLAAAGVATTGLVRSATSAAALQRLGIAAHTVDLDKAAPPPMPPPRWLFYFAPPPSNGAGDQRLRQFLAALAAPPQRLVYLSTSAVYGDCGGRWIDEDAELAPCSERGARRLDAERAVRNYTAARGGAALILRVPGIYGPGRLPVERLRAGTPVLREDASPYSNRIHADDLAAAALCVAERGAAGAAYHVSDGAPTTMSDYVRRCARLLGLTEPASITRAEVPRAFSPMLLSFIEESKRLDNRRLRALGWAPRYPTLEAGLPASLADDAVTRAFAGPAYNSPDANPSHPQETER